MKPCHRRKPCAQGWRSDLSGSVRVEWRVALIWITGTPGVGKTAASRALRARGFETYDADLDGFRIWRRRDTGEEVTFPGWPTPAGWHEVHHMPIVRSRVETLYNKGGLVFLSGSVDNELDVWDLFTAAICLVTDDATLRRRLAARPGPYGKAPDELANILEWNKTCEVNYRRFGAAIIGASRPLDAVVEDILRVATGHVLNRGGKG